MENFTGGLELLFTVQAMGYLVLGLLAGFLVGVLPGFAGANGAAIVLPFSIGIPLESALLLMAGIYAGSSFAGSIPSILMNVPGDAGAAATAIDGHPMARKGLAERAIGIARMASVLGGVIGITVVLSVIEPMSRLALTFGSRELFVVAVFGIGIIALVVGDSLWKGMLSGLLGLLVAAMSASPLTAQPRFTFGMLGLYDEVPFVPALIGLFAFAEMMHLAMRRKLADESVTIAGGSVTDSIAEVWGGIKATLSQLGVVVRSAFIGVGLGIVPGVGTAVANFISYGVAKQRSKHPEEFGQGAPAGIVASEACDNATVGGTMVPTLTLGIPGSGAAAVMLAALYLHGVPPGPRVMVTHGAEAYAVLLGIMVASLLILPLGIVLATPLTYVTRLRSAVLVPPVIIISAVGAFAVRNSVFDVGLAVVFGFLGFVMKLYGFPIIPLVIGLVLGPIMEENMMRALALGRGDLTYFFGSTTAIVLWSILVGSFGWQAVKWFRTPRTAEHRERDDELVDREP